ncbi:MAG: hypothetical protein WC789_08690 [Lentisphaeria bacterium]|jgi:hypothetical protein
MIPLPFQPTLTDAAGLAVPFEPTAVAQELAAACAATGVPADLIVPQLLLAAEDFFLAQDEAEWGGAPVGRAELDRMLAGALLNAGYGEVAAEYLRLRELPAELGAGGPPPRPWSAARVRELLAGRLPLPPPLLETLTGLVVECLAALGFARAGDPLILELAAQLLREQAEARPAAAEDSPWLIEPHYWIGTLGRDKARLCQAGVLQPQAVSRLLPVARLTLDLAELAASLGSRPLTELHFLPALRPATHAARRLLLEMRESIGEQVEVTPEMPVRLTVAGFGRLLERFWVPLGRADRRRLYCELRGLVREVVAAGLGCPLLLAMPEG